MRAGLFFLLIAALIIGFLIFDQFPGLLDGHPRLKQLNNRTRDLLGLEVQDMTYIPDRKMEAPEAVLKQDAAAQELREACGDPPQNPWSRETPPTEVDLDRYALALEVWRYCARNQQQKDILPLLSSEGEGVHPRSRLQSYDEQ